MHIIKKNIFLKNTKTIEKYSPYTLNLSGVKDPYPLRDDHKKHADLIRDKFQECITKNQNFIKQGKTTEGLYLEFASKSEYKLAFISLEDQRSHIHLLNTRIEENIEKATIFIPKGKESKF